MPDANDFVSPVVKADRRSLHLEARYNYEGFRTGSVWLGYNVSVGEKLALDLSPHGGRRHGRHRRRRSGLAVLARILEARALERKRERLRQPRFRRQLLLQLVGAERLARGLVRAGLVVQRTRLYGEDRDVQRGVLVGFPSKKAYATAYLFNPDLDKPTFVLSLGVGF